MKQFTFLYTDGIHIVIKANLKEAFTDLLNTCPGLTMAGIKGGYIHYVNQISNNQ